MFSYFKRIQFIVILLLSSTLVISLWIGRAPAGNSQHDPNEEVVALVLDSGETVSQARLDRMITFLQREKGTLEGERMNPLNHGWFTHLFLQSGHWSHVPTLKAAFEQAAKEKKEADRNWYPYSHRVLSQINQKELWEYFAPQLPQVWQDFSVAMRRGEEDFLQKKVRLYLTQTPLSSQLQERVLRHYEKLSLKEYSAGAFEDGGLTADRLAFLNNKNLSDWFGEKTIEHCARLLFIGADEAKRLGYSCTNGHALRVWQSDLESLLASDESTKNLDPTVVVSRLMQKMSLTQSQLTEIYKTLLLFRSLLSHHNQFILHEKSFDAQFASWAHKRVKGLSYTIDPSYRFESGRELMQWLAYSNRLCTMKEYHGASYPVGWKEDADYGELGASVFDLELKKLTAEQILSSYSFEQWLNWQISDPLWQEICAVVDPLEDKLSTPEKERKSLLMALSAPQRMKLEELSVRHIVQHRPELIEQLFENEELVKQELVLAQNASKSPLDGITDVKSLIQYLGSRDPLQQQGSSFYYQDVKNCYQFLVVEEKPQRRLSFIEAKSEGILDLILEKEAGLIDEREGQLSQEDVMQREVEFLSRISSKYPLGSYWEAISKLAVDAGFEGDFPQSLSSKESMDFLSSHYWVPYLESIRQSGQDSMIPASLPWGLVASALDASRAESAEYGVDLFQVKCGDFAPSFSLSQNQGQKKSKRVGDKPYLTDYFSSSGGLILVEEFEEPSKEGGKLARSGEQYFSDMAAASFLEIFAQKAALVEVKE